MIPTTIRALLAPEARLFERRLADSERAQRDLLARLCRDLSASSYGRALGPVKPSDYRERVPVVEYGDLRPYVDRIRAGEADVLAPGRVELFERTSGSGGAAKDIPYNRALRRSFAKMARLWIHDLLAHGPGLRGGRVFMSISPGVGDEPAPAGPIAIGLEDDSQYLGGALRPLMRRFLAVDPAISRISEPERFKLELCSALLRADDLEVISVWSPSLLLVLLDWISDRRELVLRHAACTARRDALLRAVFGVERIDWRAVWPGLRLISAWDAGLARAEAELVRAAFPGVPLQGKGLLATEAPVTVPWIAASGCVPLVDEVLLELVDGSGRSRFLHEADEGATYELIVSQLGGFHRYRLGDLVRVTHRHLGTPCLEFVGRARASADMVGEKLDEAFVGAVLETLGLPAGFRCLVPIRRETGGSGPRRHYALIVDDGAAIGPELATRLERALSTAHHYRRARALGQLDGAEVWSVASARQLALDAWAHDGRKLGDAKPRVLLCEPASPALLADLESQRPCVHCSA